MIMAVTPSNLHILTFLLVFSFLFLHFSAIWLKGGIEFAGSIYFTFVFISLFYLFGQA